MDDHQNPEEAAESGEDHLGESVDNLKEPASAKDREKQAALKWKS